MAEPRFRRRAPRDGGGARRAEPGIPRWGWVSETERGIAATVAPFISPLFERLIPQFTEVMLAFGVDNTVVPEVLATKVIEVLGGETTFEVTIPLLGIKVNTQTILKWGGSFVVLFFMIALSVYIERTPTFRREFIKKFAFLDPTGAVMRALAAGGEGTAEGILEGLGHGMVRHINYLMNLPDDAARTGAMQPYLAKWEEWKARVAARFGGLMAPGVAGTPPTPVAGTTPVATPVHTPTTPTPAPAVVPVARTNVMLAQLIAIRLNEPANKTRAEKVRAEFQKLPPDLRALLAKSNVWGTAAEGKLDADQIFTTIEIENNDDHTEPHPDPVLAANGVLVTPLQAILYRDVVAVDRKVNPPPKAPAPAGSNPILEKLKEKTGVDPLGFKQRGDVFHADEKAKADALEQRNNAQSRQTQGSALWGWIKRKIP